MWPDLQIFQTQPDDLILKEVLLILNVWSSSLLVRQIKDTCWLDYSLRLTTPSIRDMGRFKPESDIMIIVNKREDPGNHMRKEQESDQDKNGSLETGMEDLIQEKLQKNR